MKLLILVFTSIWLAGCCHENRESTTTLVSEVEGCRLYKLSRPWDHDVFFSSCGPASTTETHPVGKSTETVDVVVPNIHPASEKESK